MSDENSLSHKNVEIEEIELTFTQREEATIQHLSNLANHKKADSVKMTSTSSYTIDRIDMIFSILTIFLGYSFVELVFIASKIGLGFVIFTLLFTVVSVGYIYAKKRTIPSQAIPFYLITILLSLPLVLYESNAFSAISVLFTGILGVYSLAVAGGVRIQNRIGEFLIQDLYQCFLYRPFSKFGVQLRTLLCLPQKRTNLKKVLTVSFAILATFIITFVAVNILSNVDDNFARLINRILDFNIETGIDFNFFTTVVTLLVSQYLFASFYSVVNNYKPNQFTEAQLLYLKTKRKIVPEIIFILPMIVLTIVYVLFFISHAITLNQVLNDSNVVYSQYARQGFFELCQIAALNIAICLGATCCCKMNGKVRTSIIILNSFIGFSTLLVMSTAIIKLGLYVNIYGLTPKRIHAVWALFIIFITFIILILSQFKKINFMKCVSITIVVSYLVLSLMGVNQIAAKYNYTNIVNGNLKDFNYHLSTDMDYAFTPYLVELLNMETDPYKRGQIKTILVNTGISDFDVASFNLEEFNSEKIKSAYKKEGF